MRYLLLGMLLAAGCASTRGRSDKPLAPLPPARGLAGLDGRDDSGGSADFREVANRAANVYTPAARRALEGFLLHHPHHHQRPAAVAMLIGVLLLQGDPAAANTLIVENGSYLQPMERELFSGLAAGMLGDYPRALALLDRYLEADPPPRMGGLPEQDLRRLLRSTLADALAATGKPGDAMDQLERYSQVESNRPVERAYALKRAEEIATRVSGQVALDSLAGRRGLIGRAMLGKRAVAALRARGDVAKATRLEQETMAIRRQIGLESALPSSAPADPLRLGLVVPLSGPQARLGEVVLRGAALVVSAAIHQAADPVVYHLLLRDAATPSERSPLGGGAAAGILGLAREERVIGVVSTPDMQGTEFASREGVPLVLLDERPARGAKTAFSMIHTAEARAVALARKALELGARRFAIFSPENVSGKRLATAFRKAIEQGGGTVTGQITYAANATSFGKEVASLRRLPFDGLFIPDNANRLELIAPALAVADIWPRSPRQAFSSSRASSSGPGRRESLLLSTALGVSAKFLHNAERYVQGALLCPGFYPGADARSASFVSRFVGLYGTPPTATDAYGYDALFLLRGAVERGAKTRADIVRLLSSQTFEGLTGDIRFGPDHSRTDPPLVYVVDGNTIRVLK